MFRGLFLNAFALVQTQRTALQEGLGYCTGSCRSVSKFTPESAGASVGRAWGLAGALAQTVDVEDDHRAGFESKPAALDKFGQGLVDGLP